MTIIKKLYWNIDQRVKYFKITHFIFIPLFTIICFLALETYIAILLTFIYILNSILLYKDLIKRKNNKNTINLDEESNKFFENLTLDKRIRHFKIAHFILVPIGIIVLLISLKFYEAIILIGILAIDSLFAYIDLISQKQIKNS